MSLAVPADVRAKFGRRIFRKTLATGDRVEAERLAAPIIEAWKDEIDATRGVIRRSKAAAREYAGPRQERYRRNRATLRRLARRGNCVRADRLLRAMPPWLTTAQRQEIRDWYDLAASLGGEVDHIVPLKGKNVCGLHVPWNFQILSRSDNASKGNRYPN